MRYRLSILMPALQSRAGNCLIQHQIQEQLTSEVEFLVNLDNGEKSSGLKRYELTQQSQGEYLAFVDDDDLVASNYVVSILEALKSNPDLVTFNMDSRFSYMRKGVVHHQENEVWKLGHQEDDRSLLKMSANHLCVWKREIAASLAWCPFLGCGDDQLWYKPLLLSEKVKNEVHIDESLYLYRWVSNRTSNQTNERVLASKTYFGGGLRCFLRNDGVILIENGRTYRNPSMVLVRDNLNQMFKINRHQSDLQFLGTVKFK